MSEANIINDEGGPVVIRGNVTYTNPFFTLGVSQPVIILEDQAGFVDRNQFYNFPTESQVLGQITSDFYTSPFSYSLSLPAVPQGTYRDVSNRGQGDTGVMIYAVAYWSNTFGDPYLEERDQYGGGWSTAYASTRTSVNPETAREIIGGSFLIYAPDDQQGFPSGFGPDGLLFTEDDPIVRVPQGYSIVNMDSEPFTFDRSREVTLDLLEPETAALVDYSGLDYVSAFDAMIDKLSKEYAFTEYYGLDWEDMRVRYRPAVERAAASNEPTALALAIRDLLWEIPDGHVNMSLNLLNDFFRNDTDGGFGFAFRELDDGRVIINYLVPNTPSVQAGWQIGTEVLAIDGVPIGDVLDNTFIWAHQALATPDGKRLQQLRYASRRPLGTEVAFTYRNPGGETQTVTLTAINERDSFASSSFNAGITGLELPVEFRILPSGYGYVAIYSFSDNAYLTVQLWERMIRTFKQNNVPGIIIDMRNNGGGSGFLANQMSAYFFNESIILGNTGSYNEDLGDFYFDDRGRRRLYLPPEDLRYLGPLAVMLAPSCYSACEFFSYGLTLRGEVEFVGHYTTGGLGGSIDNFRMPEGISITFTAGRAVDPNGEIHIEGKGIAPTVRVPVTEETLFAEDAILSVAEQALTRAIRGEVVPGGRLAFSDVLGSLEATAVVAPGTMVQYEVSLLAGSVVSFYAEALDDRVDPILRIYNADGSSLLAENDNAPGSERNAALEGLRVTNTVVVQVAVAAAGDVGGPFKLRIVAVPGE